jgi:hypothetical protein
VNCSLAAFKEKYSTIFTVPIGIFYVIFFKLLHDPRSA